MADKLTEMEAMPLVRRALYLEKKLKKGDMPGRPYDVAEYVAFLRLFRAAGVKFTSSVSAESLQGGTPDTEAEEQPPVRPPEGDVFVPGEPRSRRYVPRGGF